MVAIYYLDKKKLVGLGTGSVVPYLSKSTISLTDFTTPVGPKLDRSLEIDIKPYKFYNHVISTLIRLFNLI